MLFFSCALVLPSLLVPVDLWQSAFFQQTPSAISKTPSHVPADSVGQPWGVPNGLLQFRGNPTHTWYGTGPIPQQRPRQLWRFPRTQKMCSDSRVGKQVKQWCGTGWTGQPVIWERGDGITEIMFGAFDRRVHFLDAETGKRTRPDFVTRDIIKGSLTLDPDGYPLIYFGSRDNKLRIVALDRKRPKELWALPANAVKGIHNNDWDGNPSVVNDILYEGGENGFFFAVKLNRTYDSRGKVAVEPQILVAFPAWTPELLETIGDRNVSIENSVALFEDRVYFANSGGRIIGLDISQVEEKKAPVVFDFWAGDDVDASIVVDQQGMLYVASELERKKLFRSREIGQLIKLNPYNPKQPLVWGLHVPAIAKDKRGGGIWSTPALWGDVIYVSSQSGMLMAVDRQSGRALWYKKLGSHLWSSPVVVDNTLIIATRTGYLYAYDVTYPQSPHEIWRKKVGIGLCIESTPAVWRGRIYVGTWEGYMFALGPAKPPKPKKKRAGGRK